MASEKKGYEQKDEWIGNETSSYFELLSATKKSKKENSFGGNKCDKLTLTIITQNNKARLKTKENLAGVQLVKFVSKKLLKRRYWHEWRCCIQSTVWLKSCSIEKGECRLMVNVELKYMHGVI